MNSYHQARAAPEVRRWLDELDRAVGGQAAATPRAATAVDSSLAAAREAHKAAWQARRAEVGAPLFSSVAGAEGAQRKRKLRLLKLMLLQIGIGSIGAGGGNRD